ncbi:50S ribosomal protein L10 [candidate division WWE3 bacterium CG_4_9_14_3_um_filter_34_6]|uniref:Large ribosomal subunit protein uL10 n=1 Tax=candidate division WWE3 bacterium CG_4_9_14_3_um_filter_34_6 TaxID=1975079 RepID=A0A2M7X2V6_UNCKA|nr:MAG: 50S ribosomal protein L10 [candidate division WWE3 bacterium CG_4_9_14_3_um_filter_34_6]
MPKNLEIKKQIVDDAKKLFSKEPSTVVFNYSKITSNEMNELRDLLFAKGATLKIIKNTLIKKILHGVNVKVDEDLKGQNAILIPSDDDFIPSLKILFDFTKKAGRGEVALGVLNGELISESQVKDLSNLPSRDELLSQVLRGMSAPIQGFAYALNGVQTKFVRVLSSIRDLR